MKKFNANHLIDGGLILRTLIIVMMFFFSGNIVYAVDKDSSDITLNLKNKTTKEILSEIEKKSDYTFLYIGDGLNLGRKVDVVVNHKNINYVLDLIFNSTDIQYTIKGTQIYISKKKSEDLFKQSSPIKRITGKVTNAKGDPVVGASVKVKNTSKGTSTNADGLFVIDAKESDILTVDFVGFLQQNVTVGTNNVVNVVLEEDIQQLEDIVVVGYGKQNKASVVSSITTINSRQLSAPTANLTNNLAGQLAGLISIQRSGEPGRDDAEFWIRGISTFQGGSTPLVLVDGIPRAMSNIEPDEIETFALLKDAAATAVYGAEGANGVILITTKRGAISKPKVSFRTEHSLSSPTRLPEFVDSWKYLELANEANFNDGLDPYIAPEEIEKYRLGIDADLYPNTQWLDELLSKYTRNQRYTLNFRGGAENAKYFVSTAYFQQDGVFKDNPIERYKGNLGLTRYNLRSNVDLRVTKTTQLSVDIAGQYVNKQSSNRSADDIFSFMLITPPHLFPAIYSDGTLATYQREEDNNNRNPYNMLMNEGYRREWNTGIQSNLGVVQDLDVVTPGLKLNGKASLDYDGNLTISRTYNPSTYHATGRNADDNLIFIAPHSGSPVLGDASSAYSSTRKIYVEGALNYQRTFADLHKVGGMILYMQKETQVSNVAVPYRKQGLVGRATYAFGDRYFIEGNFGYTGSETFAKNHRFGFFPAVGLGYYLSNEKFYPEGLKNIMDKFKLRLSYGRTGNDQTSDRFLYRATFNTTGGYFDQGFGTTGSYNHLGSQGVYDLRFVNNDIKWEIEDKRNIGLDMGFFNNRLELTVDYFNNRRQSILLARNTIPGVTGFHASPWENYGIVDNHGIDASMNSRHEIGNVKVSTRGTFTFARNKIIEYDELPQQHPWMEVTGTRIGIERLYIAERLYTDDDFIRTQNSNGTYSYKLKPGVPVITNGANTDFLGPGDVKYKDLNNDGIIDLHDMTRDIGHPYNPEINYGFGFNVEYKGFYASTFFQGTANTSILIASGNDRFWPFNWGIEKSNYRTAFLDKWSADNPSQDVFMPRLHTGYANNNNKESSTWWVRDGSFLRFKNLEVGYNMPKSVTEKVKMESVRIYLLGYNLHLWDKVKHWDPEQGKRNYGATYPLSRTFSLGLDINF